MSEHPEISNILGKIAPLRLELQQHPVYDQLESLPNLQRFMELHVYAVWDFMSLLKALQRELCCVEVPWLPSKYSSAARFINEIVLEEESDLNDLGGYSSHFELYLRGMQECGADVQPIGLFLEHLRMGASVPEALAGAKVPEPARQFVLTTFEIIASGDLCAIAAAFTFGREDLLPDLFHEVVTHLHEEVTQSLGTFKFYLDRHILLDGGQHGPMANRLLIALCEDDPLRWQTVETTALKSLAVRKTLWDGMIATSLAEPLAKGH